MKKRSESVFLRSQISLKAMKILLADAKYQSFQLPKGKLEPRPYDLDKYFNSLQEVPKITQKKIDMKVNDSRKHRELMKKLIGMKNEDKLTNPTKRKRFTRNKKFSKVKAFVVSRRPKPRKMNATSEHNFSQKSDFSTEKMSCSQSRLKDTLKNDADVENDEETETITAGDEDDSIQESVKTPEAWDSDSFADIESVADDDDSDGEITSQLKDIDQIVTSLPESKSETKSDASESGRVQENDRMVILGTSLVTTTNSEEKLDATKRSRNPSRGITPRSRSLSNYVTPKPWARDASQLGGCLIIKDMNNKMQLKPRLSHALEEQYPLNRGFRNHKAAGTNGNQFMVQKPRQRTSSGGREFFGAWQATGPVMATFSAHDILSSENFYSYPQDHMVRKFSSDEDLHDPPCTPVSWMSVEDEIDRLATTPRMVVQTPPSSPCHNDNTIVFVRSLMQGNYASHPSRFSKTNELKHRKFTKNKHLPITDSSGLDNLETNRHLAKGDIHEVQRTTGTLSSPKFGSTVGTMCSGNTQDHILHDDQQFNDVFPLREKNIGETELLVNETGEPVIESPEIEPTHSVASIAINDKESHKIVDDHWNATAFPNNIAGKMKEQNINEGGENVSDLTKIHDDCESHWEEKCMDDITDCRHTHVNESENSYEGSKDNIGSSSIHDTSKVSRCVKFHDDIRSKKPFHESNTKGIRSKNASSATDSRRSVGSLRGDGDNGGDAITTSASTTPERLETVPVGDCVALPETEMKKEQLQNKCGCLYETTQEQIQVLSSRINLKQRQPDNLATKMKQKLNDNLFIPTKQKQRSDLDSKRKTSDLKKENEGKDFGLKDRKTSNNAKNKLKLETKEAPIDSKNKKALKSKETPGIAYESRWYDEPSGYDRISATIPCIIPPPFPGRKQQEMSLAAKFKAEVRERILKTTSDVVRSEPEPVSVSVIPRKGLSFIQKNILSVSSNKPKGQYDDRNTIKLPVVEYSSYKQKTQPGVTYESLLYSNTQKNYRLQQQNLPSVFIEDPYLVSRNSRVPLSTPLYEDRCTPSPLWGLPPCTPTPFGRDTPSALMGMTSYTPIKKCSRNVTADKEILIPKKIGL